MSRVELLYLLGLAAVSAVSEVLLPLSPVSARLPFLPLLLTSVYCAAGVAYSFLRLYGSLLRTQEHKTRTADLRESKNSKSKTS